MAESVEVGGWVQETHREVERSPALIWWQAPPDSCTKLARMSLSQSAARADREEPKKIKL